MSAFFPFFIVPASNLTQDELNRWPQVGALYADLRNAIGIDSFGVICYGATAAGDGGQGFFTWRATSTAADDNNNVFKPNITPVLQPGRWIRTPLNMGVPPLQFEYLAGQPPYPSARMGMATFSNTTTFPANFAGAYGYIAVSPTATFVMAVSKSIGGAAPISVGTITISTGGAYTFATNGGNTVSFAPGDTMIITGPASADSTATDFAWVLICTVG